MNQSNLIHQKLIHAMRDVGAVSKDRTNQSQGYKYRGIEDFVNAVHPVFCKHGIFISTNIKDVKREERPTRSGGINIYTNIVVEFTFYAEDGSYVSSELCGEAMDSGDKSTNKAMSAALKYCLSQMLLIPFDMVDSEKDSPTITEAAAKIATKLNVENIPPLPDLPTAPVTSKSFEYLQLLNANRKSFSTSEYKKLSPNDTWDDERYARGIEYLTKRNATNFSSIS